jgi:acylphosphatase
MRWMDAVNLRERASVMADAEAARRYAPVRYGAAGAVVAISIAIGLFAFASGRLDSLAASRFDRLVVHEGEAVTIPGVVVAAPDEPVRICITAPDRMTDDAPACTPIAVVIARLPAGDVPDRAVRKGTAYTSEPVTASGTWHGNSLFATSIVTPDASSQSLDNPCPVPAGGWPAVPDPLVQEAELRRLNDEIAANSDLYGGLWVANESDAQTRVIVVGTTGSIDSAHSRLSDLYSGPLCIVHVDYPMRELDLVARELTSADQTQMASVDVARNLVRVRLAFLDESRAREFQRHAELLFVDPLVVPD